MNYSQLQEKGFALAKRLEALPLEERIGIVAKTFGRETAIVTTSACSGKWRGTTDVSLTFDNGQELFYANFITLEAKTIGKKNGCVNAMIARYHPDIVSETLERATTALRAREAADNVIAAEKG